MTVSEIVTGKIIEQLEKGIIPWHKPWGSATAINYISRKPYKGINIMLLTEPGEYMTYKQCTEAGGTVKKGAKSSMVVYWNMIEKDIETESDKKTKTIPILKYYLVFHISQCEGVESKIKERDAPEVTGITDKDEFVNNYLTSENIRYFQTHSDKAYYQTEGDLIHLPLTKQFESTEEYYGVLFHEMTHSTGNKKRLDRLEFAQYHSGKDIRSKEELTAEIGAAILMSESGLETSKTLKNSAAYVQSWVAVLKKDKNMIIQSASRAQKAADYIKANSTQGV